jgi:hypothetical protein
MSFPAGSVLVRCPKCGASVGVVVHAEWVTSTSEYLSVQLVQHANAKHKCEKS